MIRSAVPDDIPLIASFIRELAEYERAAHMAVATEAQLHDALFGPNPNVFTHMAFTGDGPGEGEPAGFALWFLNFSTWRGRHGLYLEDLFVRPQHRGHGYGRALLAELARTAIERECWCMQWWVLDWNTPSIDFYRSLGAEAQDEWTVFRLSGQPLRSLADAAARPSSGVVAG